MTKVIATVGYPGAGKSEFLSPAKQLGIPAVSMGDIVRERFDEEFNSIEEAREFLSTESRTSRSELVGKWSTRQREKVGPNFAAIYTAEYIEENITSDIVVIDGIRSKEELSTYSDEFRDVLVVYVYASEETRLERLRSRGRGGEETFTIDDLRNRDEREEKWGVNEVVNKADITVENEGSLDEFHSESQDIIQAYRYYGRGGIERLS